MELSVKKIDKKTFFIAIVILFFLLFVFLFIRQWGELNNQQERLSREEEKLLTSSIRLNELLEIQRRAPEFEVYRDLLSGYMPERPDEDEIIASLERNALRNGAELSRVGFAGENDFGSYMDISLNLFYSGDINAFLSVLTRLQQPLPGERVYRIYRVRLQKDILELNASVFFRKDNTGEAE